MQGLGAKTQKASRVMERGSPDIKVAKKMIESRSGSQKHHVKRNIVSYTESNVNFGAMSQQKLPLTGINAHGLMMPKKSGNVVS
jgi:hypothetical protein